MLTAVMDSSVSTIVAPLPFMPAGDEVHWYHPWGSVTGRADGRYEVHLGGTLLGWFRRDDRDRSMRNVLLVTLAREPKMHLGRLATAFDVTDRYLWVLRRKAEVGGIGAVLLSRMGGKSVVSEQKRRQLRTWFAEGLTPTQAYRRQGRRGKKLSRATISRERARWLAEATAKKTVEAVETAAAKLPTEPSPLRTMGSRDTSQLELPTGHASPTSPSTADGDVSHLESAADQASPSTTMSGDGSHLELPSTQSASTTETSRKAVSEERASESSAMDSNAERPKAVEDRDERIDNELDDGATPSELLNSMPRATSSSLNAAETASRDEVVEGCAPAACSDEESASVSEESASESSAIDSNAARTQALCDRDERIDNELDEGATTCEPLNGAPRGTSSSLNVEEDGGPADEVVEDGKPADTCSEDESAAVLPQRSEPIKSGRYVQHLGSWLLMALAKRDGLHDAVTAITGDSDSNRIALDAAIASLAIGERTIEGVRRLATPTAPLLLRVDHTPTASGVRRRLWGIGEEGGGELMARVSSTYIAEHSAADEGFVVFFVDNHLRPYSGQQTLRKSWRMQDKRVCPGATDYYVHDEDGRPIFRIDVPSHDSLTQWLTPIATRLRESLGTEERILLAFDRAGAFPVQMAALRDMGVEFVTYERRPFPELPTTAFDCSVVVRGETYQVHESRLKNLGRGRGRVRRIAVRTPEGKQINLLAISEAPFERLIEILLGEPGPDDPSGRWRQENGLKHGVERWGINQLDGRKVIAYPPDTIIPNPRRRRMDRALRLVRAEEGRARCQLAALAADDPRRQRVEADLRDAIERRDHIMETRPSEPDRLPIEASELAGKLVQHRRELKTVVDTIRIVCANGESDLASALAIKLGRPKEAKKVVANIFTAPGSISVTDTEIRIRLAPAANRDELAAIADLFAIVNEWKLTMPGDLRSRPLRVTLQPS